ncbi:coiled-coil domain-containing protein 69 [Spea bombifrons]|uniref:coiled-coil domain-containing protein 69 n=1 Tax=Spea bombifrons TaxID=233779 RepID=UPI00234A193B|nr:coiled-coil domain-containing protein 69 [Spea bombifrons]
MGCKASRLCCLRARNKKQRKEKRKETSQELNDPTDNFHGLNDLLQKIAHHEQEIKEILQKHQEEKRSMAEVHKTEMEAQKQELLEQVRRDRDADVEKRLSEQASAMKKELDAKFAELQAAYEQENLLLKENYEEITTSLQETVIGLNSQLASFQEKMKRVEESVLNQDYKKHIEDHGSPGQFWEQELQSLHFVIEMKRGLIQEQEKKLFKHQEIADRNLELEEKVSRMEHEIEALTAKIQNQTAITIRLTEELLSSQNALEKEQQLREQLQWEKEQYLYQAVNGEGPRPLSLPTSTKEVSLMAT